jgi:hypothetical protein
MAYVEFSSYAPCGFLIVLDNGDSRDDNQTTLIQSDWDYPGIAESMGWSLTAVQPDAEDHDHCEHKSTDGTVACKECCISASEFISAAYDYIREHSGENFESLDAYLPK